MTQRPGPGSTKTNSQEEQHVIDFHQVREKRLEEKRRNTERIFFKHLISVYSVIGNSQMVPINLIDVSDDGCAFQIPYEPDNQWLKDDEGLPIRLYFSRDTYLEVLVRVQNSRHSIENNKRFIRYGCTVDKDTQSYPAYLQFVRFLKLYSEHSHKDLGDVTVFYL
jgi:hypothetical protein